MGGLGAYGLGGWEALLWGSRDLSMAVHEFLGRCRRVPGGAVGGWGEGVARGMVRRGVVDSGQSDRMGARFGAAACWGEVGGLYLDLWGLVGGVGLGAASGAHRSITGIVCGWCASLAAFGYRFGSVPASRFAG